MSFGDEEIEKITVALEYDYETERALRVSGGKPGGEWLPKSLISYDDTRDYKAGDTVVIDMPEWMAFERGML